MDVHRAFVDAWRLGRCRALDEALFGQVVDDLTLADHLGVDAPCVQREPRFGGVVPHLDAQAVSDILRVEERRVTVRDGGHERALALDAVLGLHRLLVADDGEAERAEGCGRSVDRVAVLLDRQQPRDRPDVAVELERRAVRVHVQQGVSIGVAHPEPLIRPVVRPRDGHEVVTRGLTAGAGRAARALVPLRHDPGREPLAVLEARRVVRDQVDDEPELTLQSRVVADERAALVEVGLRPWQRCGGRSRDRTLMVLTLRLGPLVEAPRTVHLHGEAHERVVLVVDDAFELG